MKKWLKRIGIAVGILLLLIAAAALVVYRRANRVPDWYATAKIMSDDPDLENKTAAPLQTWASRASAGNVATKPAQDKQFTVSLTADDINRLIAKWSTSAGFEKKMQAYVKDIRVRIADGQITIAGESIEYQKIMSVVLEPRTDSNGYSQMMLNSIRVGDVPLPLVTMGKQQSKLSGELARKVLASRDQITIDDHGVASRAAADLYYTQMAVNLFAGQPADAYAFIGRMKGFSVDDPLATRVREIKIEDNKLTMTLEILEGEQRASFVDQLRSAGTP